MRYLFPAEVESLLGEAGFGSAVAEPWRKDGPLGADTWSACWIATAS
jgi:hypothetical protein